MSYSPSNEWRSLSSWHSWVATCGGLGFSPWAPGTVGSIPGLFLGVLLGSMQTWITDQGLSATICWLMTVVIMIGLTWISVHAIHETERRWQQHDPGSIVIDEVIGQAVTVLFLVEFDFRSLAVAFALFRLLDILKPWPISWLDHNMAGAWGTMIDDLAAGLAAGALALLTLSWW